MPKVLALNTDGKITYCTCPPEERGRGRCNHVAHQNPGEGVKEFMERIRDDGNDTGQAVDVGEAVILPDGHIISEMDQAMIDDLAERMDAIAGTHLTPDNFESVINDLTPEQISQIMEIGFDAAPRFSLPIEPERYDDENVKNKLYFANLWKWGGVGGKRDAIIQMFEAVGKRPVHGGNVVDIGHSYADGLTEDEYFDAQWYMHLSVVTKSVKTAEPGYTARKLFYALSDIQVLEDCGGEHVDAMHCMCMNGHVCQKCANTTKGGERVKTGMLIGGDVSTALSEGLTQSSMSLKHTGTMDSANAQGESRVIMSTLDGWGTSPIIQRMKDGATTMERRRILYEGLKQCYADAHLKIDDFYLQMISRRLTSFKRTPIGLVPVGPNDLCDIVSLGAVGNSNNIFHQVQLSGGYGTLTRPQDAYTGAFDAAHQIMN